MSSSTSPLLPVLVVDDEPEWLQTLSLALRMSGVGRVVCCADGREVLSLLETQEFGVLTLDLGMPRVSGEEVLRQVAEAHPQLPVVVVSGQNQVDVAVRCIKAGAFDYFVKGIETERLTGAVRRALELRELRRENAALREGFLQDRIAKPGVFARIVTGSRNMRAVFQYVEAVAPTSQPVLVTGESGTGKELIAHAVHAASGRTGPFVSVNVAGLDDHLFSDTLFGHTRGAFTGADTARAGLVEQAAGGTLFLDEIGDLPAASQVKLLRLLQEREYRTVGADTIKISTARIVVASNRDLQALQDNGAFRRDLYYRLCTHCVHLPPLRERRQDIPLLVDHFLEQAARELGRKKPIPPGEWYDVLMNYSFPGNVRELQGIVIDALTRSVDGRLHPGALQRYVAARPSAAPCSPAAPVDAHDSRLLFPEKLPTLKQVTQALVEEALKRANGNQAVAAELLGVTRQALHWRVKHNSRSIDDTP